jgi:hypothetical protein
MWSSVMGIQPTANLTKMYADELERQAGLTYPGQAYFADSGPFGAICGECAFWTYRRAFLDRAGNTTRTGRAPGCRKFLDLAGEHGPGVPKEAHACKYFERK